MIVSLLAAALVWIPPETFMRWSEVDALLRAKPELKLTIGLTPEMATPLARVALKPWVAAGRVEISARLHGDPVLPLVCARPEVPRPDDALERSSGARKALEKRLGVAVAGFIPGSGALDFSLIGPLGASGSSWVLAGPYAAFASSWAAEGGTVFVPAHVVGADLATPGVWVLDESALADSHFVSSLAAFGRARPKDGWVTVSEFAKSNAGSWSSPNAISAWPGWDGALASAPKDLAARAALNAYAEAAKALARYQNSGAADLKTLDQATSFLRKAQQSRFFRPTEPGAPAGLPAELRESLIAVYRRLNLPAPDSLYETSLSTSAAMIVETPRGVRATSGPTWIAFDNPAGTTAHAPASVPDSDPWRIRGLRVEWDDDRVAFKIMPARVDVSTAPQAAYDVYISLNRIVGAGSIRMLDGRNAFAQARDSWEFALSISRNGAKLWRAQTSGKPDEIARLDTDRDVASSEIRVQVPRHFLRGNPALWGYIVISLADQTQGEVLGLLAPIDVQKSVFENESEPHRLPAARLDSDLSP